MLDFEHARKTMVDNQLRTAGVTDRRILAVMGRVPRELFVPEDRRAVAYIDDVHPLGAGTRFLSAPAVFAKLVQLAAITAADSVLDLGAGTGYSTAVLAGLANSVTGIEEDPALVERANANLSALGITNARVIEGSMATGDDAAYDVVLAEGAFDAVPTALFARLNEGGRLVTLIRAGATSVAHVHVRAGGEVAARADFNASLPSLLPPPAEPEFVF